MTAVIRIDRSWAPPEAERPRPIRFCSRCGYASDEPRRRAQPRRRVCGRCGMGVLLSCHRDALPGEAAAFLILDRELSIRAVSEGGERFFGKEARLVGRHLLQLVTSPLGDDQLARNASLAAQQPTDPLVMPLRLVSGRAGEVGTMAARIGTCGAPRAALVAVEPSDFGRR